MTRKYPNIPQPVNPPKRPISFVVVRYSDEYLHNFLRSECINSPINEVIVVNNTSNLFFDNLSSAISHGIAQTKHDLVVVAHEDVLLPQRWQSEFEKSLNALEEHDLRWGILGSAGWDELDCPVGHWSEPEVSRNTFLGSSRPFQKIARLDGQILVFHRKRLPNFDLCLPGIQFVGDDLVRGKNQIGECCYVINAPTIHKYADRSGNAILSAQQSEKIRDRRSMTYQADRSCSEDYFLRKYSGKNTLEGSSNCQSNLKPELNTRLDEPIILISRGGSGSRLLSQLAQDAGISLVKELNSSGDSLGVVIPIYKMITEKYLCKSIWQQTHTLSRLRSILAPLVDELPGDRPWGFKLPESIFLLSEFEAVFPRAKYVYFKRDPLTICLRRTHLTARLDNHIGRITLPIAYDYMCLDREQILTDSPAEHMAYTTIHQVHLALKHLGEIEHERQLTISFEDTLDDPDRELTRLLEWLPSTRLGNIISEAVDTDRALKPFSTYPLPVRKRVEKILEELRRNTGYLKEPSNSARDRVAWLSWIKAICRKSN